MRFRRRRVTFGFWGIVALVWAALGVFNAVSSAVNYAWSVEKRRSFLKHRLVSFLMMLSAGVHPGARTGDCRAWCGWPRRACGKSW